MLFLCRGPNGDFSVVKASSKDEAIELLDEIGNAEGSPVTPINDNLMVHFVLTDDGDFELQEWADRHESCQNRADRRSVLDRLFGAR